MESYNRRIANQLLHDQLKMIRNVEQPEMFNNELKGLNALHENVFYGGGRPLKYVQAGQSIQSTEPSTLSVGHHPLENVPNHLILGGNIRKCRGRPNKANGGNIFDTLGTVARTAAPFAPLLMMAAGLEKKKRGRPKKQQEGGSFFSSLGSVAKALAPVAQQVAVPVATQMLQNYMSKGAGLKKRGRPKKGGDIFGDLLGMGLQPKVKRPPKGGSFFSSLGSVAKTLAPIAQQVAVPVAQQMLTNYLTKGSSSGTGAGLKKRGRPAKGGDMLGDLFGMGLKPKVKRTPKGGSFFSSLGSVAKTLAPIAQQVAVPVAQQMLTNYMTKGAGLNKRGQLIKKVMAEHGCNLGQASKLIKAHGLS